jgi:hypothetical protein
MNLFQGVLIFAGQPHVTCATRIVQRMDNTNMNVLREKLCAADAAGHVTFVARTSVAERGGHGVYALRDFVEGELLSIPYPGVKTDNDDHDLLHAFDAVDAPHVLQRAARRTIAQGQVEFAILSRRSKQTRVLFQRRVSMWTQLGRSV